MCVVKFSYRLLLLIYVADRLEIVPVTHSDKQRTLEVTGSLKDEQFSFPRGSDLWSFAPPSWLKRAKDDGIFDLMGIVPYAPLVCVVRGKLLCMAAGPYALVISLALESNVIGIPTSLYRRMTKFSFPGPNKEKGGKLRVFRIPTPLLNSNTVLSSTHHTIKIMAAFVSEEWTWIINDFTSLIRMHLFIKGDSIWTEDNLRPGTSVCLQFHQSYL